MRLYSILSFVFIILSLLLYTHYFNFILWKETNGPKFIWLFITACIILLLFVAKRIEWKDINNERIFLLFLIPLIAEIVKYIFSPQTIETARISVLMSIATLQYYLLKGLKVTEKQIMYAFSIFGLITLALQIYQQLPNVIPMFGIIANDESYIGAARNDLYRFYVGCYFIAVICSYYWWTVFLKKKTIFSLLLFICFISSIYIYLIRQLMVVSMITLVLTIYFIKDTKVKRNIYIILFLIGILLVSFYDALFSEMVEDYTTDTWTTDIRFKCIDFVLVQIFDNPIQALIGHGHDIIEQKWMRMHYFLSDIGFIGESYYYGLSWLLLFVSTFYSYVFKYKSIPLYIKLYMIATMIDSLFIFPYRTNDEMFIWICLLYIGHIYIDKSGYGCCQVVERKKRKILVKLLMRNRIYSLFIPYLIIKNKLNNRYND